MQQQRGSIEGGRLLRRLRERKRWSQFDLAVQTEAITQGNYSNIESGKTQPSSEKLEDILAVLDATTQEREEVLKYFGYLPATPLPTAEEIDAVIANSQAIWGTATVPVFLVDIVTRLIHWNRLYARLLGDEGDEILETMRGRPLMQMAFESKQGLGGIVDDLDAVLLDEANTMHRRLQPFQQEDWVADFIEDIH